MTPDDFPHPPLDDERIMRVLAEHAVAYVLIGGLAAEAHGSQRATFDIDIVPDPAEENLARLAMALEVLDGRVIHAVRYDAGEFEVHVERPAWHAGVFRDNPFLRIRTTAGDLDVLLAPDGLPAGYAQLLPHSALIRPHGIPIRLAGLDDIVASKRASGRSKDLDALAELEALRNAPPYGAP